MNSIFKSFIFLFLSFSIHAQDSYCHAEELQINFIELMQLEEGSSKEDLMDLIVLNWENYKCNNLETPKMPESFIYGHLDFLVNEIISSSRTKKNQDVTDACLEAIKTLGLMHYMYSNHQNGISYLALTSQLFYDVKNTAFDVMLDKYEWFEFKQMVEELNGEWYQYTRLAYDDLSLCHSFKSEKIHSDLVDEVSNCLHEILACFESAYRPDFELPCLEMEYSLSKLLKFYSEFSCKENQLVKP